MLVYTLKKLLAVLPLLWGVVTLIFLLVELSPGDATDRFFTPDTPPEVRELLQKQWGLDQPWPQRYVLMLTNLAQGEFGRSIAQSRDVWEVVGEALPNTLLLGLLALVLIQVLGVALGTVQAIRQYSAVDAGLSLLGLLFYSMPAFWLALMLQLVFSLELGWLPSSGRVNEAMHDFMTPAQQWRDRIEHLILPVFATGVASAAGVARYMRSSLLEVIRQDYIRTARAKGLGEGTVILKHALRNALLPIVTILGLQLPFLVSGAVLIEAIFGWPGMGRLIYQSILNQDSPVIIACFFVFTLMVVLGNLAADLLCALVDPRIRYS